MLYHSSFCHGMRQWETLTGFPRPEAGVAAARLVTIGRRAANQMMGIGNLRKAVDRPFRLGFSFYGLLFDKR
jgi:hypothetical protein